MTTWVLAQGVTAVQAAPAAGVIPAGSQSVQPSSWASGTGPGSQTYQLIVLGTGAVSATAQIMVSNDGINWSPGPSIPASGSGTAIGVGSGTQPWAYVTAYVTKISGTGATAQIVMGV